MKTVHEGPAATITYDPQKKRLVQKWTGFAATDRFRAAIDATVEFCAANEVKTILSDTLDQKVVKASDSEYAASTMPALFQSGLVKLAFVLSKDILTKMSVDNFKYSVDGVRKESVQMPGVSFFSSVNEAAKWLDA